MMKNWMVSALCSVTLLAASGAMAQAVVGKPAPAFTATDVTGKTVALSNYKGKFVVLEWTNPDCPFVGKHYNGGSMPATQRRAVPKTSHGYRFRRYPTTAIIKHLPDFRPGKSRRTRRRPRRSWIPTAE